MVKDQRAERHQNTVPLPSRNLLSRFPKPLSRFLGYRETPPKDLGRTLVAIWALVGAFAGVVVLEALFMIPSIRHLQSPTIITSFGAAAILEFNAIQVPLAQPRNSIIGHVVSTAIGIGIAKLFQLSKDFENLRWLAGGLGCGSASAVMTLTGTVYPPAGATALQAAVDPKTGELGWYLLPLVFLSSVVTLIASLLVNNIQRRFPVYWWTPMTSSPEKRTDDVEKTITASRGSEDVPRDMPKDVIMIACHYLNVPEHIVLTDEEKMVVEALRYRLRPSSSQS